MAHPILVQVVDGALKIPNEYARAKVKEHIQDGVKWFELKPRVRESQKQRGFYHGAICALYAYYHEGMSHTNAADLDRIHEWLKIEHHGEWIEVHGKAHKVGKSTKRELNSGFLERCIADLVENYGLDQELLDTNRYMHWRDAIYPNGGPKTYIDYLASLNLL